MSFGTPPPMPPQDPAGGASDSALAGAADRSDTHPTLRLPAGSARRRITAGASGPVSIRRTVGASETGKLSTDVRRAARGAGWVTAGAVFCAGLFALWQLLFAGGTGGDVWLGRPWEPPVPVRAASEASATPAPTDVGPTDDSDASSGSDDDSDDDSGDDSSGPSSGPSDDDLHTPGSDDPGSETGGGGSESEGPGGGDDGGDDDDSSGPGGGDDGDDSGDGSSGHGGGSGGGGDDGGDSSGHGSGGGDDGSGGHGRGVAAP